MALSRRKFIALVGGGIVVAATGSAGAFVATRTPERALRPWDAPALYREPRLRALSWAVLSPNPHNRQPWLVELKGTDTVILTRDPARRLPHTDPFDRQIIIGFGCFLELMVLAARETGHRVDLDLFPAGETGPVAVARFVADPGIRPDPLFAHAAARRSCKEPFEARALDAAATAAVAAHATVITAPAEVEALRDLTWRAWMIEATTARTFNESVDLMRFGRAEIEANPDGIDLGGPMLEALMLAGVLTRESQRDPKSSAFQQGIDIYRTMLAATPAYAVVTTTSNNRLDQIAAGRRWLRLNLATTAAGLALHPVSQCLQEFPEMAEPYREAHQMLAKAGETVQMLGRVGYGPSVPRTPRWPLETRLVNA